MKIKKVKKQSQGYLVTLEDGQEFNISFLPTTFLYDEVLEWLKNNTPEPEFTEEELQITSINKQIQEAKTYLASTAWYVERLNDPSSGKAIPEEVLAKRAEARELINTLEAELGGL